MKSYVITSSCDSAGYEMLYLLYAITRNKYVDSGTKFWYDIVYSWTAPSSVLASIFHLSSSKMKRCKRIQNMIGILLNQFNVFEQDNEIKNIWYRKNVEFLHLNRGEHYKSGHNLGQNAVMTGILNSWLGFSKI